jgi:hypothetical protein
MNTNNTNNSNTNNNTNLTNDNISNKFLENNNNKVILLKKTLGDFLETSWIRQFKKSKNSLISDTNKIKR